MLEDTQSRHRVVLVNDDRVQRLHLCRLLESEGLIALPFAGAVDALEGLQRMAPPDLIITDLNMPGMDGWGFCRLLRSPEFPTFNRTPILVVSATFSGEEPARITADLGANAFLPAPVEAVPFLAQVRRLLAGDTSPLASRVLIVEDARSLCHMLSKVFSDNGYLVDPAGTGADALRLFRAHHPDIVVLDYHLPDMQGDQILMEIQAMDPRAVVLVMTADPSPELALKVVRMGARGYLRKPFDPKYLLTLCANARREMSLLNVEALLETRTQELRASETRLKQALEATQDAVWDWDLERGSAVVTPSYYKVLGYPQDSFTPSPGLETALIHPQDLPRALKAYRAILEQGAERLEQECRMRTSEGDWAVILTRGLVVARDEHGRPLKVVGIHSNVTAQRKAAEALRVSEEKLSKIFNLSPSAIVISRLADSVILEVNESFYRNTGYSREETLGHSATSLNLYVDTAARAKMFCDLQTDGELHNRELQFRQKNGNLVTGLLSAKIVEFDSEPCLLTVITDISVLKGVQEAHLELLDQMRQLQKLESVGRLAGGVAHDFNNLLSPILNYAELLLDDLPEGDPRWDKANQILRAAQRGRDLTRQLLAFSRKQVLDLRPIDLREVILGFEKLLRRTLRENIVIQMDLPDTLPQVRADAGQMEQVLMNLAVNAQDAMPEGGLLSIGLSALALDTGHERQHPGIPQGRFVQLAVGDTGGGMTPETLARIFEPFFTTKGPGKGTGLGLATVFGIVKQHGGHVRADSELGAGATFRLYLPSVVEAIEPALAPVALPTTGAIPSSLILLVEDDPEVRESTRLVLEHQGFSVLACEDGVACLRAVEDRKSPVALLLTDVVMPKLSGPELYQFLKAHYPDLRAVFMSGYLPEAITHPGGLEPGMDFLQKPFTSAELLAKLREVLVPAEA
ncbi:MAG: response regulator [Holophaga sp.]